MRELTYTLLELEKEYKNSNCEFCSNRRVKANKAVKEMITRHGTTDKLIAVDVICEECEEKYWNNQILKCGRCGRLQTRSDFDLFSGENICYCIRNKEDLEEKEPSPSPPRESTFTFYERQINALREEKVAAENTIEEEREAHEDFMKVSEEWSKRQKQELLDRIKELEGENKRLKEQNQKLVPEELTQKIDNYEKEIEKLKKQLEEFQLAQIEVPPKRLKTS